MPSPPDASPSGLSHRDTVPVEGAPDLSAVTSDGQRDPSVSDFEMLKRIGRGSYGQVWLARSATGSYRAVKVVHREAFDGDRPYDREFEGIREFEPLSRAHPGQLDILHVGREAEEGYFYYVMELADDASQFDDEEEAESLHAGTSSSLSNPADPAGSETATGSRGSKRARRPVNPATYQPLTLHERLRRSGRLRFPHCLDVAVALAEALEYLHTNDLVHRDIKPANIVFVRGRPKLADIGLVAQADARVSIVGTEGFLPPEGPGKAQADLYSLGKVFYEMATGKDRRKYPEPPDDLSDPKERKVFLEFNEVLLHCCEANAANRYQNTSDLLTDLHLVRQGRSVRRLRQVERKLAAIRRGLVVAVVAVAVLGVALWQVVASGKRERKLSGQVAERKAELEQANSELDRTNMVLRDSKLRLQETSAQDAMKYGDLADALVWSAAALQGAEESSDFAFRQRFRIGALLQHMPLNMGKIPAPGLRSITLSEDGESLVVGSISGVCEIWDLESPLEVRERFVDRDRSLARLSPDGNTLALFSDVNEWSNTPTNYQKPKLLALGEKAGGRLLEPAMAGDEGEFLLGGEYLLALQVHVADGPRMVLWDVASGAIVNQWTPGRFIRDVTPHPTLPCFLSTFRFLHRAMGSARMWNPTLPGEEQRGERLAHRLIPGWHPFSPDGSLVALLASPATDHVARVEIYRLADDGTPTLFREVVTEQDQVQRICGGGILAGNRHLWIDFASGAGIWEIDSGRMRKWVDSPPKHSSAMIVSQRSRDGKMVALMGDSATAFLDGESFRLLEPRVPFGSRSPRLASMDDETTRCVIGPERPGGRVLAVAAPFGDAVHLINLGNLIPPPLASFEHPHEVQSVDFSPDMEYLLTGCADQVARVWHIPSGALVAEMDHVGFGTEVWRKRLSPWTERVRAVEAVPFVKAEFGPTGEQVVVMGGGTEAWLWSWTGEKLSIPFTHEQGMHEVAFRGDGRFFLTAGGDWVVNVMPNEPGARPVARIGHGRRDYSLDYIDILSRRLVHAAFHPSRTEIITCHRQTTAAVTDWTRPSEPKFEIEAVDEKYFYKAEYTPDGSKIVALAYPHRFVKWAGQSLQVFDADTGAALSEPFAFEGSNDFSDFALSPDSASVFTFHEIETELIGATEIGCWDISAGTPRKRYTVELPEAVTARLSRDGTLLLAATAQRIQIFDAEEGIALTPAIRIPGTIVGAALAPDNRTVAVGCADGTASLWRFDPATQPAEDLLRLAQFHSWKKVVNDVTLKPLTDSELDALQQTVEPLPRIEPVTAGTVLDTGRQLLQQAIAAGDPRLADAGFLRMLDGLEAEAKEIERGEYGERRAADLRRMAAAGRLLHLAQRTLEFGAGYPLPELPATAPTETLVRPGAPWRYFDEGAPPPGWRQAEFDDSAWPAGDGPLGFGDDQTTILAKRDAAGEPLIGAAFRHRFAAGWTPGEGPPARLVVKIRRDDGAVVYLNGEELLRSNMPAGPIEPGTLASEVVNSPNESDFHRFEVDAHHLRAGDNILAVEVHQVNEGSSDLTFDLELQTAPSPWVAFRRSAESLEEAVRELDQLVPPEYDQPWREFWELAVAPVTDGQPVVPPAAVTFRKRVQALLAGAHPVDFYLGQVLRGQELSAQPSEVRRHKDLLRRLEERLVARGRLDQAAEVRAKLFAPPPRDPGLDPRLIDLTEHFQPGTSSLYDGRGWHASEFDLRMLPETFEQSAHGPFDLRGVVQLNSGIYDDGRDIAARRNIPLRDEVTGIHIGQRARRLHFLHGEIFGFEDDREVEVARYVVHFQDGREPHVIAVKHARDVVDWRNLSPLQDESGLAWAFNDGGTRIGVTKLTWENPEPERTISHLDFVSAKAQSAPFLLAVTVE